MYYLMEGTLQLIEIDKTVSKGAIIGEIGMFSPSRERTATAVAATDCRLLSVDDSTLYQAYYQNPKLGFYLISLIAGRFVEVQSSTPGSVGINAQAGLTPFHPARRMSQVCFPLSPAS